MIPVLPMGVDLSSIAHLGSALFTPDEIQAGLDAYHNSGVSARKFVKQLITNKLKGNKRVGKTQGEQLKLDLGLGNFQYVVIQQILPAPCQMLVVTYDSRRPFAYIAPVKVRKISSNKIIKIKKNGRAYLTKPMRLTPPTAIAQFGRRLNSGTIVIVRDLAGEYLHSKKALKMSESKEKIDFIVLDYNA